MPFEYTWEKYGFYSRFWGNVTLREIEAKNRHFSNDLRCDSCLYQIIDGTDIESFILPSYGIKDMASNDIGMNFYKKNLSVILVSSKPQVQETFQRYVKICQEMNVNWKFHLCNSIEQATNWIGEQAGLCSEEKKRGQIRALMQPRSGIQNHLCRNRINSQSSPWAPNPLSWAHAGSARSSA